MVRDERGFSPSSNLGAPTKYFSGSPGTSVARREVDWARPVRCEAI